MARQEKAERQFLIFTGGAGDTLVKLYNPGFEAEKARAGPPVHVQPNSIIQFLGLVV